MTTLLALAVLWQFRIVVVYLLISLALAAVLRPLVDRLAGRGIVARVAWILLYLAVLGSFAVLLFAAAEAAISEVQQLVQTLSAQDAWTLPLWLEGSAFQQTLVARLPPPSRIFEAITGDQGQLVLPAILGLTQGMGSVISGMLVILFLSLYWSINQNHFERLWLSLLPSGQRQQTRDVWQTVESDIGAYIHGQIIHSLLVGLLLILGFWLLGSPYPALLALAGALASLIPVVGPALVVISVLLVGLLSSVQLSLVDDTLRAGDLDCPDGLGQAAPVQTHMGQSGPDRRAAAGHGRCIWPDRASFWRRLCPSYARSCGVAWSAAARLQELLPRFRTSESGTRACGTPSERWRDRLWPLVTSSMERLDQLIAKAEPLLQAESAGRRLAG